MVKMVKDKRITVNIERCVGCHTCELECAVAHSESKNMATIIMQGEKPGYRIMVEAYKGKAIPVRCNQCEQAACVLACPTGAVHRPGKGGPVLVDRERCIGCRMCVQACPFGVMSMDPDGKSALKCDLCVERLAKHLEPACVASCPTRALSFDWEEDSNRAKRLKTAETMANAQESATEQAANLRKTSL